MGSPHTAHADCCHQRQAGSIDASLLEKTFTCCISPSTPGPGASRTRSAPLPPGWPRTSATSPGPGPRACPGAPGQDRRRSRQRRAGNRVLVPSRPLPQRRRVRRPRRRRSLGKAAAAPPATASTAAATGSSTGPLPDIALTRWRDGPRTHKLHRPPPRRREERRRDPPHPQALRRPRALPRPPSHAAPDGRSQAPRFHKQLTSPDLAHNWPTANRERSANRAPDAHQTRHPGTPAPGLTLPGVSVAGVGFEPT